MKLILILATLILSACGVSEEPIPNNTCHKMTFSDALPVQIWLNGCETFNEKAVCGIHNFCFCQPFNCSDEIKIQFKESGSASYKLLILNTDGEIIKSIDFVPFAGIYDLSFVPEEEDICGADVSFKIVSSTDILLVENNEDVGTWINGEVGGRDWEIPPFLIESAFYKSGIISPTIANGTEIEITINLDVQVGNKQLFAVLSQSTGSSRQTVDFGASLLTSNTETVTVDDDYDQIELYCESEGVSALNVAELSIVTTGLVDLLTNTSFNATLLPWYNALGFLSQWSHNNTLSSAEVTMFPGGGPAELSDVLTQDLAEPFPYTGATNFEISLTYNCGIGITGGKIVPNVPLIAFSGFNLIDDGADHTDTVNGYGTVSGTFNEMSFEVMDAVTANPTGIAINVKDYTVKAQILYNIPNRDFETSGDWTNTGAGMQWYIGSYLGSGHAIFPGEITTPTLSVEFYANESSEQLINIPGATYEDGLTFSIDLNTVNFSGGTVALSVTVSIYMVDGFTEELVGSESFSVGEGTDNISGFISAPYPGFNKIVITAENTGEAQHVRLEIGESSFFSGQEVGKSDCISIKEDHKCTTLITYSNNRNFAGIKYSDFTPDQNYSIRIPAIFFQERFPEENEVMELSDNREISLNSQVKVQRLLDIGHMPYYMHLKMKLILSHQYVLIDGRNWVKSEAYEILDGNKRFPMKRGQVWLTQQDYIVRNIL